MECSLEIQAFFKEATTRQPVTALTTADVTKLEYLECWDRNPFILAYASHMLNHLDWPKTPVRLQHLLPQHGEAQTSLRQLCANQNGTDEYYRRCLSRVDMRSHVHEHLRRLALGDDYGRFYGQAP